MYTWFLFNKMKKCQNFKLSWEIIQIIFTLSVILIFFLFTLIMTTHRILTPFLAITFYIHVVGVDLLLTSEISYPMARGRLVSWLDWTTSRVSSCNCPTKQKHVSKASFFTNVVNRLCPMWKKHTTTWKYGW